MQLYVSSESLHCKFENQSKKSDFVALKRVLYDAELNLERVSKNQTDKRRSDDIQH